MEQVQLFVHKNRSKKPGWSESWLSVYRHLYTYLIIFILIITKDMWSVSFEILTRPKKAKKAKEPTKSQVAGFKQTAFSRNAVSAGPINFWPRSNCAKT